MPVKSLKAAFVENSLHVMLPVDRKVMEAELLPYTDDRDCVICLEELRFGQSLAVLGCCRSFYHKCCLEEASIKSAGVLRDASTAPSCPCCRHFIQST